MLGHDKEMSWHWSGGVMRSSSMIVLRVFVLSLFSVSGCWSTRGAESNDTGEAIHCGSFSTGDAIVHREGTCQSGEMILVCRAETEPCPDGTTCVLEDGIAACL
jgi:hypothetical protein